MQGTIKILPETLVNKIKAGEVIERPAHVVKELVENSIDAKATEITINIQNAGKTLIQVIDNGIGMSAVDARLAFERHATSKISKFDDIYNLHTKGFRGEALASIAAVSYVELKTRTDQDKIGTKVVISGGKFVEQQNVNCPKGANFLIKNLFFNVPARRNFLRSDATEFRHILNEFYRLAIPHNKLAFSLYHNQQLIYKLKPSSLKERIVNLFDRSLGKYLIPIETDAGFVKIFGYIGSPEAAKKRFAEQFFFVNSRFFQSMYLHRAVIRSFDKLLQSDYKPLYFIFIQIDPSRVDVNIHPRKIEVSFQDEDAIYQLILAAIRKGLAQYGVIPSIDFETHAFISEVAKPDAIANKNYTTPTQQFASPQQYNDDLSFFTKNNVLQPNLSFDKPDTNWEETFKIIENKSENFSTNSNLNFINLHGKYIITTLKSGLAIIHQFRAYETIFFNLYIEKLTNQKINPQNTIYPVKLNLNPHQISLFDELKQNFETIGFRFEQISEFSYNIIAIPEFVKISEAADLILEMLNDPDITALNIKQMTVESLALLLARSQAKSLGNKRLTPEQMENIANKIFALAAPFSPSGKKIFVILKSDQIEKLF